MQVTVYTSATGEMVVTNASPRYEIPSLMIVPCGTVSVALTSVIAAAESQSVTNVEALSGVAKAGMMSMSVSYADNVVLTE